MKITRAIALSLLLSFPAQAIDLPDLGESARVAFSETQEAQVGREIMRKIRADQAYLDDPEITEYLDILGERLAAASPDPARRFSFFAVKDATINAFALPGGYIGVHTGLISAARSESELAGVLAHEIAHVTQSHIARIVDVQKNAALTTLAAIAVAILAARSNSQVSQAAVVTAQAMNIQTQLDYTRDHEREADRVGLQTLDNAGFDGRGMATFFERLQAQGRLYDNSAPAYLRTHPLTHERISDIQDRLTDRPYRQSQDSFAFALIRAKVQSEEGEPAEAHKRFIARAAEQPGDPAVLYGLAASALRAGDPQAARRTMPELEKRVSAPMVATLGARIDQRLGNTHQAVGRLAAAWARHRDSKPLAFAYAEALLNAGETTTARALLEEQIRLWPEEPTLYRLLSRAQLALGHKAASHLAQAEAYLRLDLPAPALDQLQLASKAGDGDFYTLSIVDARAREVRDKIAAEARKPLP